MAIKVTYYLFTRAQESFGEDKPEVLGVETHEDINEILTPDTTKSNTTITRYFSGHPSHRWVVQSLDFDGGDVSIYLSPRDISGEVFLSQTMKRVKRSAIELLRFGTIVEVDFGFRPKIYKRMNQAQTSAKRYPDAVQEHELYKRRPAIVLKATKRGVQVIPLTSQEPSDFATNHSVFKLKKESLADCTQFNKDSYVLSHLIQTVGYSRILPPLSKYNSYSSRRVESYRVRICRQDEMILSSALAHNVGFGDYYEKKKALKECEQQLKATEDERSRYEVELASLRSERTNLNKELEALSKQYDTLRQLLRDQYLRSGVYDEVDVDEKINDELSEFAELVGP